MNHDIAHTIRKLAAALTVSAALEIASTGPTLADSGINAGGSAGVSNGSVHPDAELTERGFGEEFDIELSNRNLLIHIDSRLPATVGIASLSVDPSTERFNAIITVPAGDPRAKRFTVVGRIFALLDVPVPVTTLRPGETIRADDIVWKPVRAPRA